MLSLVGAGPGHPDYLCKRALELLSTADRVLAFGRIAESLQAVRTDINTINRVSEVKDLLLPETNTVLLASGDALFFGIGELLLREGIVLDEVVPGISSVQYLAAKLQIAWQDAFFVSYHGREADLPAVVKSKKAFILTDSINTPAVICQKLYQHGRRGRVVIGYRLSYGDESIITGRLGDQFEDKKDIAVIFTEDDNE